MNVDKTRRNAARTIFPGVSDNTKITEVMPGTTNYQLNDLSFVDLRLGWLIGFGAALIGYSARCDTVVFARVAHANKY